MAADQTPIVLVASGTSSAASATYRWIEAECGRHFPGHPIHWAFSSGAIRNRRREETGQALATPATVLDQLARAGCRKAVVQSLHLICGLEFHGLVWKAAQSPLDVHLGLPLLSHPEDFDAVLDWIEKLRPPTEEDALVFVGHGTDHPAWMAYAVLAGGIAARFGDRVVLGQVKGDPGPSVIAAQLGATGCRRARLRPFMLVAGAHFRQDISGDQPTSWQSRFEKQGLRVIPEADGLGVQSAIIDIFGRHIRAALAGRPLKLD
ncbi:MAG: sirohydrochlorin cobaltochelatase [Desulfosarcina sp.]|nr:sirohydrochlorin cobaltochelatase [Desulfobacterales bacterium]